MSYQSDPLPDAMPALSVNSASVSLPVSAHLRLPPVPMHSDRPQTRPENLFDQPNTYVSPAAILKWTSFGNVCELLESSE